MSDSLGASNVRGGDEREDLGRIERMSGFWLRKPKEKKRTTAAEASAETVRE